MGEIVTIKGNRYGLNIILEEGYAFEAYAEAFQKKLEDGKKFFGDSKVSIQFEGSVLSSDQQQHLMSMIHDHTDMTVFCIIDENTPVAIPSEFEALNDQEIIETKVIKEVVTDVVVKSVIPREAAVFHHGTMRSGQEIHVESGIVVLGDVNPGAKITAKGNIIVLGKLKGYAHAGSGGVHDAYIYALTMQPTQLRIGDLIARSPDKFERKNLTPEMAFVEDGHIVIDTVDTSIYRHFQN